MARSLSSSAWSTPLTQTQSHQSQEECRESRTSSLKVGHNESLEVEPTAGFVIYDTLKSVGDTPEDTHLVLYLSNSTWRITLSF